RRGVCRYEKVACPHPAGRGVAEFDGLRRERLPRAESRLLSPRGDMLLAEQGGGSGSHRLQPASSCAAVCSAAAAVCPAHGAGAHCGGSPSTASIAAVHGSGDPMLPLCPLLPAGMPAVLSDL